MTDSSGGSGFGPAGTKIRLDLKRRYGTRSKGRSKAKQRPKKGAISRPPTREALASGPSPATEGPPLVTAALWHNLRSAKRLESVLLPPELLYYLRELARFVEIARTDGLARVVEEFGIRETSTFNILRRKIGSRAPGNTDSGDQGSEHHSRAGGAFLVGSKDWAQEMTGEADPTQVLVGDLVEAIRRQEDLAKPLMLSARLILNDFGQRVIRRSIRQDDPWGTQAAGTMIREYYAQLDAFFAQHAKAARWRAASIEGTLKELPPFVAGEQNGKAT
jgi:hypothetical protein